MAINFPNDPATNPGDGGTWIDGDGNTWTVEIVSGEAIWTMTEAADTGGGGGGAVTSVNTQTGDVSLGIRDMNDYDLKVESTDYSYEGYTSSSLTGWGQSNFDQRNDLGWTQAYIKFEDLSGDTALTDYLQANLTEGDNSSTIDITIQVDGVHSSPLPLTVYLVGVYIGRLLVRWEYGVGLNGASGFEGDDPENWNTTSTNITWGLPGIDIPIASGDVLQWNDVTSKFEPAQLPATGSPLDGLLSVDGDAVKYGTAPTLGVDATDVVIPTMGQVRAAIASNGGTSVSLNDLTDVSYSGGSLQITNLDEVLFDSSDVPGDATWKFYVNPTYGLNFGAYLTSSTKGSFIKAHHEKGISLGSSDGTGAGLPIWFTGEITQTTNQPEIRFSNGNPWEVTPTGNYLGFKMPAGVTSDVTWTLPAVDGAASSVLTSDGAGNLTFEPIPAAEAPIPTYVVGFESTTSYKFTGPGLDGTELNPTLYFIRGQKYIFSNTLGAHPFQLQTVAGLGESPYTDGVTGDQPIDLASFEWEVPMDAPSQIFYQCTVHADMSGTIEVLDNTGSNGGGFVGTVNSVNGKDGEVLLGIQDMIDYDGTTDTYAAQPKTVPPIETLFTLVSEEGATEGGTVFTDESPLANGVATVYGDAGDVSTKAASAKYGNYGIRCEPDVSEFALQYPPSDAFDFGQGEWTMEFWRMHDSTNDRSVGEVFSYGNTVGGTGQLSWDLNVTGTKADNMSFGWTTDGTYDTYDQITIYATNFKADGVWSHYALVKGGWGGAGGAVITTEAFPANAGPIKCKIEAVTGVGEGGIIDIYTDGFGDFDFSEFDNFQKYNPFGWGYQIGDEVAFVPIDGSAGRCTTTVGYHRLVVFQDGVAEGDYVFNGFDGQTIYSGDSTQCLTLFNTVHPGTGELRTAAEGNFDELRITKGVRYRDEFTPEPIVLGPDQVPGQVYQGDVMRWQNATQKYKPEPLARVAETGSYSDLSGKPDLAASAPVQSVNSKTGEVSLGIQDMDDYGIGNFPPVVVIDGGTWTAGNGNNTGEWQQLANGYLRLNAVDNQGKDWTTEFETLVADSTDQQIRVQTDSLDTKTYLSFVNPGGGVYFDVRTSNNFVTWSGSNVTVTIGTGIHSPVADSLQDGDVLTWNATDSEYQPKGISYGSLDGAPPVRSRILPSVTTAALAIDATETGEITGTGATGFLLSCQTDTAAWVRIYCDSTSMTADAARDMATDPAPGSGVLFEAMYSTFTEKPITPGTTYFNLAGEDKLYYRITNKSAIDNTPITVTFKLLPME